MKMLLIFAGLFVAGMIGLHTVSQNGSLIRFLDEHPNPKVIPPTLYWMGTSYYILGDLANAATCYWRITDHYSQSSYGDDAYFHLIQSQDDMNFSHNALAEGYSKYLELYPQGHHTQTAQRLLDYHRNVR